MFNDKIKNLPAVSVIIPVYNNEKNIGKLIESLLKSDYPKELLEIIIVDNGSNDRTKEMIRQYPTVVLLEEKNIQSSYAARNKGIQYAKNEILAFIDSDCIATPQWIKEGVNVLVSEPADLAGGKVEFVYSKHKTAAELYDSISNMQNKFYIKEGKTSSTANLFVKSSLFERIGMFPDWIKSGGDVQWTAKATRNGFSLVYAPKAIVKHPARFLKDLLKKKYRVGTGIMYVWINENKSLWKRIYLIFRLFLPPRFSFVKNMIYRRGTTEMKEKVFSIWWVSYLCKLSTGLGILSSLFNLSRVDRFK